MATQIDGDATETVGEVEHLADSVAHLLDTLLDSCPRLRVLVTSREALGLAGEVVWRVASPSVPDTDRLPALGEMTRYEAVRLFKERAQLRLPAFELTPEDAPAVAEVCRKLEGIPLAIELATARMGTLSVRQISERLKDPLSLLTRGSRTAESRQQTLRGTLDWSYELLSEFEQTLFGRLSAFASGWTLEAAETLGTGDGIDEGDVLDLLSGLVEKSLVVAESAPEGRVRYRMLEPVRQYARERLEESEEVEEVRRRHAAFFLALAEDSEPKLRGPRDMEWLGRLELEHDNLRAALSWVMEQQEAELALRLAGALWMFWEARGHYSEGRGWLEEALEKADGASAAARAKALEGFGWLVYRTGEIERAVAAVEEGLKLSDQAGLGGVVTANFLRILGWMTMLRGDLLRAKDLFQGCLRLSQDEDDKLGIAEALLGLGAALDSLGDRERAKELHEEGIVLARELSYVSTLAHLLFDLGYTLLLEGNYERGAALNEEAAALFRERRYKGGGLELVLDNLGWAALLQGDHDRARASYQESLMLCKELGDRMIASESLEGLACISAVEGEAEQAAILFGTAEALREAVGDKHTPEEDDLREPYLAGARSRLDEATWEASWAEGRAMSMEQAIGYALSEENPAPLASAALERSDTVEPPNLTRRETEVALLVARGFTNHQIAQELVLSEHTVITHVRNILKKLNLRSRTQLTLWVTERQLHP